MAATIASVVTVLDVEQTVTSYRHLLRRLQAARRGSADEASTADLAALSTAFALHLSPAGAFSTNSAAADAERLDVRTVDPHVVDRWEAYARTPRTHPLVRARLHHLLHAAGRGGRENAAEAIAAYRQAVPLLDSQRRGARFAARSYADAFRLARHVGLTSQRDVVAAEMLTAAEHHLSQGEDVGVVLELLEPLAQTPAINRQLVTTALESACAGYAGAPHQQLECLEVLRTMHPGGPLGESLDVQIVNAWRDMAATTSGFRRLHFLDEAARHARAAGLTGLYDEVRLTMQQIGPDELTFTSIRIELDQVPLMNRLLAPCIEAIDTAVDLREALWQVGALPAPAGVGKAALRPADPLGSALMAITTYRVNTNGPVLTSHQSGEQTARLRNQLFNMDHAGHIAEAQLDQIGQRFGPVTDDLLKVFHHDIVLPEESALVLSEAFQAYWIGIDRLALRAALPIVEGMLRRILRQSVPVITPALGDKAGRVSQLGSLISEMAAAGFDPQWQTSLRLLLADPKEGRNLRNEILHDLQSGPTPRHHIALVLQAALFLLRTAHERIRLTP